MTIHIAAPIEYIYIHLENLHQAKVEGKSKITLTKDPQPTIFTSHI